MKTKLIISGLLLMATVVLWFAQSNYVNLYLTRGYYTVLSLLAIYVFIKVLIEQIIGINIKDSKTRFSMRKVASMLSVLVFIAIAIAIWIDNLQALLVSYGILAAGAAVALQDVFKNVAGTVVVFTTGVFHIGDRIEINSKIGDVIDIGIFSTTLLETNEWVNGDQATGRLSIIPNSVVLSSVINNYTKDHPYIWDEIQIPITYQSDWQEALRIFETVVITETKELTDRSEASISKLSEKYYLPGKASEPIVFANLTDNWINMSIRFITETRQRRTVRNRLYRRLLTELSRAKNVTIASESIDVSIKELPDKQ